eukprot:GDKK01051062.1.p1 GENE.GDKK01051062.1~~GDKK01051062.1.p1  ORF type:complete len:507 (+),score=149.11 GDKK01051062.1:24-1523(+)
MSVPPQGQYYAPYGAPMIQPHPGMQYGAPMYAPQYSMYPQPIPAQRPSMTQRPVANPMNDPNLSNIPPQIQQKLSMGNGRLIPVMPGQQPPPGSVLVSGPPVAPIASNNVAPAAVTPTATPITRPSQVPPPNINFQNNPTNQQPSHSQQQSQQHLPQQVQQQQMGQQTSATQTPTPPVQQQVPVLQGAPQYYTAGNQYMLPPQMAMHTPQQAMLLQHHPSQQNLMHPGMNQQQMMNMAAHMMAQQPVPMPQQQPQTVDHTPSVRQMESFLEQATAFCTQMDEHERAIASKRTQLVQSIHNFKKQLTSVAAQSGSGPSHPRDPRNQDPPFFWTASPDYAQEFAVSGSHKDIVSKVGDFEDQGWVIPVAGSLRMVRGSVYRWGLKILRKCPHRPQMQFGLHGLYHEKPWRLITTSRCSRSKDDEPWQDRPEGDRLVDEGDVIWMEVDLRVLGGSTRGTLSYAINEEPWEVAFSDIPLNSDLPLMPVVSMGGDGCAVQVLPF